MSGIQETLRSASISCDTPFCFFKTSEVYRKNNTNSLDNEQHKLPQKSCVKGKKKSFFLLLPTGKEKFSAK